MSHEQEIQWFQARLELSEQSNLSMVRLAACKAIEMSGLQAEIKRLRGILKRVTPDPVWGEDPISKAYYKEARAALQPKEGE